MTSRWPRRLQNPLSGLHQASARKGRSGFERSGRRAHAPRRPQNTLPRCTRRSATRRTVWSLWWND